MDMLMRHVESRSTELEIYESISHFIATACAKTIVCVDIYKTKGYYLVDDKWIFSDMINIPIEICIDTNVNANINCLINYYDDLTKTHVDNDNFQMSVRNILKYCKQMKHICNSKIGKINVANIVKQLIYNKSFIATHVNDYGT